MADGVRKKSRVSSLVWLGLLGLAIFLAVKTGWAGFGWAQLRSRVYPRNDALLAWVPSASPGVVILDPHQITPQALGSSQGVVRGWLERVRGDVKKATSVDLFFDVDKVVLTPNLTVMTGRFDGSTLAAKLADYQYLRADYGGHGYLARTGEDAVMVVDDDTLLYGDEPSIKAAIDAKAGTSLAQNDQAVDRLARIGWDQPLIGTVQLSGDRPSLRAMITGATGPRAVTFGVRGGQGLDVRVAVETAGASAAGELAKALDEKRAGAVEAVPTLVGPALGVPLAGVLREAIIKADSGAGQVLMTVHVTGDTLDAMARGLDTSAPWAEGYKGFRLFQLLAP